MSSETPTFMELTAAKYSLSPGQRLALEKVDAMSREERQLRSRARELVEARDLEIVRCVDVQRIPPAALEETVGITHTRLNQILAERS